MKVLPTKEIAEKELKRLQEFYKQNCHSFELDDLEELVKLLEKLYKLYLKTDQGELYKETMERYCYYDLLFYIAKRNGWMEVTDLDFTVSRAKNVQIVLDYLKGKR